MDMDLRLHQRALFRGNYLNFVRAVQISGFLGAEAVRSSGSQFYANAYNLFFVGTTLNFLIGKRWSTGGEIYFGRDASTSEKLGFGGNVQYYFDRQFSLGLGYKAYFFKTTSPLVEPANGPYREGVGEAYSTFKYQY